MKNIALTLAALVCFLFGATAHAESKKILLVVTNHGEIAPTGAETGYFLSEVAHPWHVFREAGFDVEFASPQGGFSPMDPKSFNLSDEVNKEFWHTLDAVQGVTNTTALSEVDLSDIAGLFFAGGHGTMWDFPNSESVSDAIAKIYERGGVVGAVCHGPAALVDVKLSDGSHLLEGKVVTSFTNAEEDAVKLTEAMPFLLETKLRELGAEFHSAENFQQNVVVDGRLVTGQNPASATQAAEEMLEAIQAE